MKLIIVSGRSGSGKSTAIQVLEDLNFYCVDNLPLTLLTKLTKQIQEQNSTNNGKKIDNIAVGIDARNLNTHLESFSYELTELEKLSIDCEVIFLDAIDEILLNRFHASRRKHPLSNENISLMEAISYEENLLKPIEAKVDLHIDTSGLTIHQLREQIKQHIYQDAQTSILIQSFSYKHGIPIDADLVFDTRCLINPHWQEELKTLNGLDQEVVNYLSKDKTCQKMIGDLNMFLNYWIPEFEKNDRSYLSIAIGCTGGQHRSVFVSESLAKTLKQQFSNIQIRHRELSY